MNASLPTTERGVTERLIEAPPLVQVAVWVALTAGAALAAHLLAAAVGLRVPVGNTRVLIVLAGLTVLSLTRLVDRRTAAQCGLALPESWAPPLWQGIGIGAGVWAVWYVVGVLTGALRALWPAGPPALMEILLIVPAALVVAVGQQVLLSGWVLGVVRERHGVPAAVALTAVLAAFLQRMETPLGALTEPGWDFALGVGLTQAAMALLRVITGHVLHGSGILTGAFVARRALEEMHVLEVGSASAPGPWLAPDTDLVAAPLFWVALGVVIAVEVLWLASRGEAAGDSGRIPISLKRIYPLACPMSLAPLRVHLQTLGQAGGAVGVRYLPRLVAMWVLSAVNEVLCLPERILGPLLTGRRVPSPVFILGVHRSGTTHLHNLLALDPALIAPRNHHTFNPLGAVAFGWPMATLLAALMPWRRPMDAMRFHLFSTSEEEFAIANLCRYSPYWGVVFAAEGADYDRYLFPGGFTPRERAVWQRAMRLFLGKLVFWTGRRPVLKNPCNTGRLSMLLDLYPDARIVHIYRHPHDVYRSNAHLEREAHVLFQLQEAAPGRGYLDRFPHNYAAMEEAFYAVADRLPPDQVVDVRFDDLERDPMGEIERIYTTLRLPLHDRFRARLARYLGAISSYRRNQFQALPERDRRRLDAGMAGLLRRWGWKPEA